MSRTLQLSSMKEVHRALMGEKPTAICFCQPESIVWANTHIKEVLWMNPGGEDIELFVAAVKNL